MMKKMKKWSGIYTQIRITTKHQVTPCPCLSLVDVRIRVRRLSCLQNDRTNDRQNIRLVGGGNDGNKQEAQLVLG